MTSACQTLMWVSCIATGLIHQAMQVVDLQERSDVYASGEPWIYE